MDVRAAQITPWTINALSSGLPTGANNIGNVTITAWPAVNIGAGLPTGANNIGTVNVASGLPTGANNIGTVNVASGLPTGANTLGALIATGPAATNVAYNVSNTPVIVGGVYYATQPTINANCVSWFSMSTRGAAIVATGVDVFVANLGAGSANIGYVGGFNQSFTVTPTINLSSYAAAQSIGGSMGFTIFRSTIQPSGVIDNFWISSKGGATAPITIYIFNKPLAASTNTDHVAFALGNADISSLVSAPFVITPSLIGSGTTASFGSYPISISVKNQEGTPTNNLYVIAVQTTSAQTYLTTTDLIFGMSAIVD